MSSICFLVKSMCKEDELFDGRISNQFICSMSSRIILFTSFFQATL